MGFKARKPNPETLFGGGNWPQSPARWLSSPVTRPVQVNRP